MTTNPELANIPIGKLRPSTLNPRFEVGDVTGLASSIAEHGILVPLVVTPRGKGYLLVAGHRRLAAAKSVGMKALPCVVRETTEVERLELMLVENQQRVALSPVEEGVAYARILKQYGINQRQLAQHIGVSEWTVSTRLAILRLPKHAVDAIHRRELSVTDALGYGQPQRTHRAPRTVEPRPSSCSLAAHKPHSPSTCEVAHLASVTA